MTPVAEIEIGRLQLSTRARNALRRLGCTTLGSILEREHGPAWPGLGPATRAEVAGVLEAAGFNPPPGLLPPSETPEAIAMELVELCDRMETELQRWMAQVQSTRTQLRRMLDSEGAG